MRSPTCHYACRECGVAFETTRTDAYFCATACRKTWNNRRATRGAQLYDAAMQWRTERGEAGKVAMSELRHVIGGFIRDDRARDRRTYIRLPRT